MDIQKRKQELRQRLLEKRSELTKEEYTRKSAQIIRRLKGEPEFKKAHTIHCYVSINERNEVNTRPLIKALLAAERNVVIPVTNFDSGILTHVYLNRFSDLKKNEWGVPEPIRGEEADTDDLDLVIVPMAGGDYDKNRIGYGKGFYDRFLQQVGCPAVGLLFERCLVDTVPTGKFDVPLDKLVTEKRTIC